MITAFKPSKPDRPRTLLETGQKDEKEDSFALKMKTPKETSVLIAFEKPTATWDIKMEDVLQLAAQELKTTCSKKLKHQHSIATIEYYILHAIYHMNGTQVMSVISNHDFNTKLYVKAPRYDKTSR